MRTRVTAVGEATSLSDRKRRAGQRLVLVLVEPRLDDDTRALLRELTPAGFVVEPGSADEPGQLLELSLELAARLPASQPPLILARHRLGAPCPGGTAWPAPGWLARADDPVLSARVGRAWRDELAALGFHLHLAPPCDLEPLGRAWLPGGGEPSTEHLLGPEPGRAARAMGAFVAKPAAAAACPSCCQGFVDEAGRLVALEKELPGLWAEDLAPVRAAVDAGVPALLVGAGRWSAFHEERPACCEPSLLRGALRGDLGFGGLLLGEDLSLEPVRTRLRLVEQLLLGVESTVDGWLIAGTPESQLHAFEALVRLQEERPVLDDPLRDSDKRLLAAREALLLRRRAPGLELVGCSEHRDLAFLARARGA